MSLGVKGLKMTMLLTTSHPSRPLRPVTGKYRILPPVRHLAKVVREQGGEARWRLWRSVVLADLPWQVHKLCLMGAACPKVIAMAPLPMEGKRKKGEFP